MSSPAEIDANLVPLGRAPDHPRVEPELTADGLPVLEEGEAKLYSGPHPINILTARSEKDKWKTVIEPSKAGEVTLTDRRCIVVMPRWKSDKALGSMLERRVMTKVMEREYGKQALAAQVRYDWTYSVTVSKPKGMMAKVSSLQLRAQAEGQVFTLGIKKFEPAKAQSLAKELVATISADRLAHHSELTPDFEEKLTAFKDGSGAAQELNWGSAYNVPAAYFIPRLLLRS